MTVSEPAADAGPAIDLTLYPHLLQTTPSAAHRLSWADFVESFKSAGHPEYAHKKEVPLWAAVRLAPNKTRTNDSVLEVSAMVFDIDDGGPAVAAATLQALKADGIAFLAHTSYSHGLNLCGCAACEPRGLSEGCGCKVCDARSKAREDGKPLAPGACEGFVPRCKVRIICPLADPIMGAAWRPVFMALRQKYAPTCDTAGVDRGRAFYLPSRKPGAAGHWMVSSPGRALVGTDIATPEGLHAVKPRELNAISEEGMRRLAKRFLTSKKTRTIDVGEMLLKVLDGVGYAADGTRNRNTFEIARHIAEARPDVDPVSVGDFFQRSITNMPGTKLTTAVVADMVKRAQAGTQAREDLEFSDKFSRARIAHGTARVTAYTPDELQHMARELGVEREDLHRYFLVTAGPEVYVLTPGPEYKMVSHKGLAPAAYTMLAPVPEPFSLIDVEGKPKNGETLLREYSTPLDGVIRSLYDAHPRIEERKLILPACTIREMTPKHDDEIAEWLRLLGGDAHADLLTWLGLCTNLRTPLPALVMIGDKGSGKSLLGAGLARLWTKQGPTTLDVAMGAFNDRIESCPLVFGDEHVPRDNRGNVRTEELRALIQAVEHNTNQKHRAFGALRGAVRVVIAANNQSVIELRGHLTREDVDAIAERLFYVDVSGGAAARYLRDIGGQDKTREWVAGDGIARHVLALPQPPVTSRFGFLPSGHGLLAKRIAVRSGIRSAICEWIVKGLVDQFRRVPRAAQRKGQFLILPVSAVYDSFDAYAGKSDRPPLSAVSSALAGVALRSAGEVHVVDLDMLRAWCREHGYVSPDKITGLVAALPEAT